ncbi:MAG: hypothetical protein Ct9H300mP6_07200 [Gammaproteobacteria bacterium]|nr:MAG: hypothetical protein Ct9H300mP6_07200 [Gammaproteobacteria bacterium]
MLAGPKAREVMAKVTEEKLDNASFPWLTGKEIKFLGCQLVHYESIMWANWVGKYIHPLRFGSDIRCSMASRRRNLGIADFWALCRGQLKNGKSISSLGW